MAIKEDRKKITLIEYDELFCHGNKKADENNSLPEEEFDGLKNYILDYPTEDDKPPLAVKGDHLKATNYVGAILTEEGTQIEILPKIDLGSGSESAGEESANDEEERKEKIREIFIQMVCTYLYSEPPLNRRQFNRGAWGKASLPLLDVFMDIFLQNVSTVVQRGLARAYIPYEENLTCLKGKLDFSNHIRHNLFHKERFYVRYDEFSIDRPINRVLKKALRTVRKVAKNQDNYRRASQLLNYFEEVRETRDWRHEVKISSMDRSVKFEAYEHSFEWAKLILRNFSPDNWEGERKTISLLFPMEKVFEYYITQILKKSFRSSTWHLEAQNDTHQVMAKNDIDNKNISFTIKPDLVAIDKKNNHCVILDAKWKIIGNVNNDKGYSIKITDIYQLYSYGKTYQRKDENGKYTSLALLYPRNKNFANVINFDEDATEPSRHKDSLDNANSLNLKVFPIDLSPLAQAETKGIEKVEQEIAETIISECITGHQDAKQEAS